MVQALAAFDWVGIAGADSEAQERASRDARALARVLALQDLVQDRDGAVAELPRRVRDVAQDVWPNAGDPLADFGLHASPASFLVARVAVGLVPVGRTSLRHEPLTPEGVTHHLTDLGVDDVTSGLLVRGWSGVPAGSLGDPVGLSPSLLAGLAERTLTPTELERALIQVAWSPRCLERLAATLTLSSSVRGLMTVLPPESLGPELAVGIAGMTLGRPDRVIELLGAAPSTLGALTFAELAQAQQALAWGQVPEFSSEVEAHVRLPSYGDGDTDPQIRSEKGSDSSSPEVIAGLEMVPGEESSFDSIRPVRWGPRRLTIPAEAVDRWLEALRALGGGAAPGAFLGLRPTVPAPTVRPVAVPPDVTTLMALWGIAAEAPADAPSAVSGGPGSPTLSGRPDEPLYPAVRGALRLVAGAAEGQVPRQVDAEDAGDLDWLVHRTRTLGLMVQGDIKGAVEAGSVLPPKAAPELRWATDLLQRYGERAPSPLDPEEARPAAAELVGDLAHQLSRTLAGTVPKDG